ncbi:spinster family MFS transporter [Caulobacter sp. DWP3-1-3b2]|uniref:spinster family MFS transporter n=1 Tax=Caulobacter sp. DWP3-1-3b2 TaxID=2804643 RepID=UPI003CF53AEB
MTDTTGASRKAAVGYYPYYVVGVLMLMYVLSFTDRAILGLMVDPIRRELDLTDTHISILSGFAFALFYSVMGLPFAKWADTRNRKILILFGAVFWSLATVACGLASGFWGLLVARFAVGIGEATLSPAAYSMIADYFPPRKLGFAMSLYSSGITIGGGLAMVIGGSLVGWAQAQAVAVPGLGDLSGWRLALMMIGAFGLAVPLLLAVTVREPSRRPTAQDADASPDLIDVFRFIAANGRVFFGIYGGYTIATIMALAQIIWAPSFFIRVHHMDVRAFGLLYGVIMGVGGTLGLMAGGLLSDAIAKRGRRDAPMIVILMAVLLQFPFFVSAFLVPDRSLALILFGGAVLSLSLAGGLQGATLQLVSPERMRGRISAIYIILTSITGGGLVPVFIAALSEHVFTGENALGKALAATAVLTLPVAALILAFSLRQMREAVVKLRE